jgi:hypothetical protein
MERSSGEAVATGQRAVEAIEALGLMGSRALAARCAIGSARCGLEALGAGHAWCWALSTMLDARRCDSPQLVVEVCWKVRPTQLPRSLSTGKPLAWLCASVRCAHCHSDVTLCNSVSLVSRFTSWVR